MVGELMSQWRIIKTGCHVPNQDKNLSGKYYASDENVDNIYMAHKGLLIL